MANLLLQALHRCSTPLRAVGLPLPTKRILSSQTHTSYRGNLPLGLHRASFAHKHLLKCHSSTATNDSSATKSTDDEAPHIPVLLEEIMGYFEDVNVRVYVDGTLGAGGHASNVVSRHPELETLVGFDLDPTAHGIASERISQCGSHVIPVSMDAQGNCIGIDGNNTTAAHKPTAYLVRSNFSAMGEVLPQLPGPVYGNVDAMLLDLGISSMQVDISKRGFSFLRDGPLDMRMDPGAAISAEVVVNSWSETQIGKILKEFGEERYWKSIARRIASAREESPILTTQQLVKVIGNPGGGYGKGKEKKHPATRTFQALRIAVNGELESIANALPAAISALAPGGRLAVITFHSLEDRIVKWAFRQAAGMAPSDEPLPSYCVPFDGANDEAKIKILTRRPVLPGDVEQAQNSRSRSAKLRVVERLAD